MVPTLEEAVPHVVILMLLSVQSPVLFKMHNSFFREPSWGVTVGGVALQASQNTLTVTLKSEKQFLHMRM